MINQPADDNSINNTNPNLEDEKFSEESKNNCQPNPNLENNPEIGLKENLDEGNLIQNQNINNPSNEEIMMKINALLQQNQLNELSTFLSLNKNNIPKNVLSSYISFILESYNGDLTLLNIFLENGANVDSPIHNSNCQIEEKDKINLLIFSIITNNFELFKLVVKYNPDILLEDKSKKNSLIYCILFNDNNFAFQELLKLNSKAVNSKYYEQENNLTHNLLTLATSKGKKNIVAALLLNNCDINYQIPETGETALHIAIKNDNIEIAEILNKNPNIIKNIKNKMGETPKDICKEKKGKIFFRIVAKENQMNNGNNSSNNYIQKVNLGIQSNNNELNMNNNEFNTMNNFNNNQNSMGVQNMDSSNSLGVNSGKKKKGKKEKFEYNNNDLVNNLNENYNMYYRNNNENNLIIPIEFQNDDDYPTYLSMGQDIKLCLNLFQSEDSLTQQIEELEKQLKEKNDSIQNYEELIQKKENEIATMKKDISDIDEEIKKQRKIKTSQEKQIAEIKAQNEDYKKLLKNLKIMSENKEQNLNEPAPVPIVPENKNNSNDNELFNFPENQLTEEEFKFLEDKFHSQSYDHNYIVSCLQKDLTDYQAYVKEQISLKKPVIQEILQELQSVVNEINSNYKVNLYGSYCTGLCLPWSDIDTVITCESGPKDEFFLSRLNYKLSQKPWVREHKFIENTAIPIIKLISNDKFNFHIDISEESEKHFGLKTVELVKSYLKEYSVLEPIILALKTLLNNGSLNNPYTGGLSSYGLILMVVSFIQSEIDNEKYNEKSPNILGETFLNVLGHYGIFFDYNNYVIITYPVNDNNDNSDRDDSFSFMPNSHELIIVDPLNKQNNVAKSTFQFMNIKMGFLIAFMVAKEDCECGCHYGCIQNKLDKTEHCILKRIFNSIKRFKDANKNPY